MTEAPDRDAYLAAITREGEAFLAAARAGDPAARVPSCPDWNLADLTWHLAEVHWFWAAVVADRLQDPSGYSEPARPSADALIDFAVEARARLERVLRTTDPATPVWTWADQHDVAFVLRRQAQETLVHRWDAQSALGAAEPLDPALAADGVDEFVTVLVPSGGGAAPPIGGAVELVCRGTDDAWRISDGPDALVATAGRGAADASLVASPSDLLLALWRRIPLAGPAAGTIEITGDRMLVERLVAHTSGG